MNRTRTLFAVSALMFALGCKHEVTGPDGTKVTTESGGVTTVENDKVKATYSDNGKKMVVEGKDGSKATLTEDGKMVGTSKDGSYEINGKVSEADLGVPFYPGSTEAPGSMKVDEKGKKMVSSSRQTSDPGSKVVEFYISKLGKPESKMESGDISVATWKSPKVTLSASKTQNKTIIQVVSEK
jgi:hypothetical protein